MSLFLGILGWAIALALGGLIAFVWFMQKGCRGWTR